ncbi:hypothetical protein ACVFYP_00325 [Roseomonas sp. F4]
MERDTASMLQASRAVWFAVLTVGGLLMLDAPFGRAVLVTIALLALRLTPVPPPVVFSLGAVIFALGLLQWATGILLLH